MKQKIEEKFTYDETVFSMDKVLSSIYAPKVEDESEGLLPEETLF